MTETTGANNLLADAKTLHTAFKSGKVSEWTWWEYPVNANTNQPNQTMYASKHYFQFVRENYKMIECNSSLAGIWSTAFKSPDGATVSIVLINAGSASTSVSIAGSGLPAQFDRYESGNGKTCFKQSPVTVGATMSLPANSVTTLSNLTVRTTAAPRAQSAQSIAARVAGQQSLYTMDGRLVGRARQPGEASNELGKSGARLATGTYCSVASDKSVRTHSTAASVNTR
jgi:hypothetical protein